MDGLVTSRVVVIPEWVFRDAKIPSGVILRAQGMVPTQLYDQERAS
jgi:hypothetical protein